VPAPMAAAPLTQDPVPFPGARMTGDAHLESLLTPHPLGTLTEKVTLTGARDRIPIKTYVLATGGPQPTPFTAMADKIANNSGWRLERLACGHNTMMEMPQETLGVFLRAAN
ncbi:MAG TPA: hypothetical protein VEH07_00580, partial [Alphaproteobacteria bacterium]|nr:hypothetical protein [Alphaproteobacteria bacterium]